MTATHRASRSARVRMAITLVPLALISAAWTADLVGGGVGSPVATAGAHHDVALPDGSTVPSQAIQVPASVSIGESLGLGVDSADAEQIVSTSSTSGIPSAALAAYQRAETVMNAADTGCHLSWQLIAAIGRVESDHGRADGNVLNDRGIAIPGIYGIQLDGTHATTAVVDSDAGQYDHDTTWDRAVGPMQFLPSTWSVVGVDADGDGARNPQDINDAALGTAVYLCSGSDDLSTDAGQRAAVYRYNHSESYVDLVLAISKAYLAGDYTSIPNGTVLAAPVTRNPVAPRRPSVSSSPTQLPVHHRPSQSASPTATPTTRPIQPTQSPQPTSAATPTARSTTVTSETPTVPSVPSSGPSITVPGLPSSGVPIDQTLTLLQAQAQCTADGIDALTELQTYRACVDNYMHPAAG